MWNQTKSESSNDDSKLNRKKSVDQTDSEFVDSGFLSSKNLLLSSNEIDSSMTDMNKNSVEDSSSHNIKHDNISNSKSLKTDSGLDLELSQSLNQMSLKEDDDDAERVLEPIIKITPSKAEDSDNFDNKQSNIEPWQLYYIQDDDGDTQLHIAIIQGNLEAVAFSLIRMAPHPVLLDILNDHGQSALHLAVLTQQPRIVRRLVLGGANLSKRNIHGNTALHLACSMGDVVCARALTDPLADYEKSYLGIHKKIPALPQNLEQRNYKGETCLHIAAAKNHVELVRLLLRLGADLEAREGLSGRTALHISLELGCKSILNFLLKECRPSLHTPTYAGLTAYQYGICLDNIY